MQWKRHDKYAEVSEDGRYSVAAYGTGDGWKFEGWRTRAHKDGPHLVCANVTAEEARQHCEADALETAGDL